MPVIFNEPLSFLQRLTEYMEHTYLIHQANATTDSVERMKVPQCPRLLYYIKTNIIVMMSIVASHARSHYLFESSQIVL